MVKHVKTLKNNNELQIFKYSLRVQIKLQFFILLVLRNL